MTIRLLTPADAAEYRAVMLEAYERHPDAFGSTASERGALPLSWWEERLRGNREGGSRVFGAFHGDALAGAAGLMFEARQKSRHRAELFGMYVRPAFRHRGTGRALVRAALEHAVGECGVWMVHLTVTDGNAAAERLYAQCGFVRWGVEPCAMATGDGFAAKVHMWCDLRGGVPAQAG